MLTIAIWAVVGATLAVVGPHLARHESDTESFLPEDSEQQRAMAVLRKAFPSLAARSQLAVIICRPASLQAADFDYLVRLGDAVRELAAAGGHAWTVLSPAESYLRSRLVSPDGRAAMLVVNLPAHYAGVAAARATDQIEVLARRDPPPGLQVELSGTAAGGRDFARASRQALRNTKGVTVCCVLLILLLVYRSPVAAIVPIVGIGACTIIALSLLDAMGVLKWHVSDIERMFTVVLIYGAGTDFAMFWLARYQEEWSADPQRGPRAAAAEATARVGPAIVASAGTTILGLLSLITTQMTPTRSAGKILPIVLCLAPVAGITLVPAMICLVGRFVFWPAPPTHPRGLASNWIWPRLARLVVRRPGLVLLVGTATLLPWAVRAGTIRFRYDTLAELPPGSTSHRGAQIAREHFEPGILYPVTLLIAWPQSVRPDPRQLAREVAGAIRTAEGVQDVYDLTRPLGLHAELPEGLTGRLLRGASEQFYYSAAERILRIEVILRDPPFSHQGMETTRRIRARAEHVLRDRGVAASVLAQGATPYILEVQRYVASDQWRVWLGATPVIFLVVAALVRRILLSLFMIAATLLTYAATIGLAHEFFTALSGGDGLDYKVKLFLFVIIMAVGQDYNIFLVSRLREDTAAYGDDEGTQRAVVRTGSVISSCGIIMAATLGSLYVGRLELLRQLGFALALGMLLDTFIVRPLMMPSYWLLERRLRSRGRQAAPQCLSIGTPAGNDDGQAHPEA